MSRNGRPPPSLHLAPDTSEPVSVGEFDHDEDTNPDPPNAVTHRVLLRAMARLEIAFTRLAKWLIVSSAISLGALLLVAALWVWLLW